MHTKKLPERKASRWLRVLTFWKGLMATPPQLAGYGGVFHGQAKTWAPRLSARTPSDAEPTLVPCRAYRPHWSPGDCPRPHVCWKNLRKKNAL